MEVTVRENYTYPKISLSRGVVLFQSTFHLVFVIIGVLFLYWSRDVDARCLVFSYRICDYFMKKSCSMSLDCQYVHRRFFVLLGVIQGDQTGRLVSYVYFVI